MRIGRWRRLTWREGEAGKEGRIGEEEEGGGIESGNIIYRFVP